MTCESLNNTILTDYYVILGSQSTTSAATMETRVRSCYSTPNYLALRKSQLHIPSSSYINSKVGVYHDKIYGKDVNGSYGYASPINHYGGGGIRKDRALNLATDRAIKAILKKGYDVTLELDVLLGEASEGFKLVGKYVNKIAKAYSNLRKGRFRDTFRNLGIPLNRRSRRLSTKFRGQRKLIKSRFNSDLKRKTKALKDQTASQWLELQFGWKPMYQDIFNAAEAAADLLHRTKPPVFAFKTQEDAKFSEGDIYRSWTSSDCYERVRGSVKAQIILWYGLEDSTIYDLQSTGLSNPAGVAWELLPASFVVDWVLPVGDYINSFYSFAGLKRIDGCLTVKTDLSAYLYWVSQNGWAPCGLQIIEESMERTGNYALPSLPPPPEFQFKELIDSWKVGTGLALLNQVFK